MGISQVLQIVTPPNKIYFVMMKQSKISVIVPVYNAERYISDCLESVLTQTLKPLEIIVCDDASTDSTQKIVASYAKKYPSIMKIIFHDKNQGIPRNFNSGLRIAKGDYVSLLSGDDYWLPNKLELELNALQHKGTKWAYSKVMTLTTNGKTDKSFWGTKNGNEGNIFVPVFARELSPRNFLIDHKTLANEGYFDESLELFEDWDLKIRLAKKFPIAHVPSHQIVYRRHSSGISRTKVSIRLNQALYVLKKNKHLFSDLNKHAFYCARHKIVAYYLAAYKVEKARSQIMGINNHLICWFYLIQMRFATV